MTNKQVSRIGTSLWLVGTININKVRAMIVAILVALVFLPNNASAGGFRWPWQKRDDRRDNRWSQWQNQPCQQQYLRTSGCQQWQGHSGYCGAHHQQLGYFSRNICGVGISLLINRGVILEPQPVFMGRVASCGSSGERMERRQVGVQTHEVTKTWKDSVWIEGPYSDEECSQMAKEAMQATYGQPNREQKVRAYILARMPDAKVTFRRENTGETTSSSTEYFPDQRQPFDGGYGGNIQNGNYGVQGQARLIITPDGQCTFSGGDPVYGNGCENGYGGFDGGYGGMRNTTEIPVVSRSGNQTTLMSDGEYTARANQQWGSHYVQNPAVVRRGIQPIRGW